MKRNKHHAVCEARPGSGRVAVVVLLALAAGALQGCAVAGIMAEATQKKTPAAYELAAVPTLIMVEDRGLRLRDPALTTFMANAIAADLRAHQALGGAAIIEQAELARVAGEFGRDFDTLGIDEVGQRAGASQVLYVEVQRVRLERAPGLWDPEAVAGVKVIDAVGRRRVFPPGASVEGVSSGPRGRPVLATLPVETPDTDDRAYRAATLQRLARALASRVSELFYAHRGPQPGDRLPG